MKSFEVQEHRNHSHLSRSMHISALSSFSIGKKSLKESKKTNQCVITSSVGEPPQIKSYSVAEQDTGEDRAVVNMQLSAPRPKQELNVHYRLPFLAFCSAKYYMLQVQLQVSLYFFPAYSCLLKPHFALVCRFFSVPLMPSSVGILLHRATFL